METTISLPAWPSSLPLAPLIDAYNEAFPSLMANVTTGNKSLLLRKMASRSQITLDISFNLTEEQATIFEEFFYLTLDGGSLRFTFTHPRKKTEIEVSFSPTQQTAFTLKPNGSMEFFEVSFQLLVWS